MKRRAMTVIELLVASAMLATLMVVCMQMFVTAAAQRRAAAVREIAIREAANLMERLAAVPFDQLNPESVAELQLSDEARSAIPGRQREIQIDNSPEEPEAKRITVLISFKQENGQPAAPVRLVAWRWKEVPEIAY